MALLCLQGAIEKQQGLVPEVVFVQGTRPTWRLLGRATAAWSSAWRRIPAHSLRSLWTMQ